MRNVQPRNKPSFLPVETRRANFKEVIQGYDLETALEEADRCISCENPRCEEACPLHNAIPQWIAALKGGRLEEAYRTLRQTSPMPELCSRLCPQERLCEGSCAMGIKHESVAIGPLERYVAEEGYKRFEAGRNVARRLPEKQRKTVAAVGSGPASLAFAQVMAREGHAVTVFERWPRLGGVLRWIPRFKLPVEVLDRHLKMLADLGVEFKTSVDVRSAQELLAEGYDGVFLGIGASRPSMPRIPGITLSGVLSSTEFLVRVYYDPAVLPNKWAPITDLASKRIVVLGGGDSAMDCVRTAIRLGAAEVSCLYRRDEANMPGSKKELKAALEEGAHMQYLVSPTEFFSDDGKAASKVRCVRMALGAPDASGRRSPKAVAGSEFEVGADLIVLAFGYEVEHALEEQDDLIEPSKGTIRVHPLTGATPFPGIVAGGDCVTGPNLVCTAARAGVTAARGLLRNFAGEPWDTLAN